ncbi:glycosyltransferase family 2 protein [Persicitalea jodogahamensis]|uniref:Glycosyl transferase n=1 Tax=Persicitalea jodogahamensis TaxID=402147 RepID=A0A8J3DC83_9BACT|nr:glycosyltransferase family 2 protein [Persicitalea jodogahamensis]GHB75729.1 glycosyl transferase [Persicitalea jodogahamensis]
MKISVITVAFNAENTIRDTIESVLAQDFGEVEYIVVDGKSTDATAEIVKSYGDRIARFISEPDQGIYDAMNKGIQLATGEVIGLLNADDLYASIDVLSQVMDTFLSSGSDAVYGDLQYFDSGTGRVTRNWRAGGYRSGIFLWGWMPPHPSFFIRRSWYQKHGGFRLDMGTAADYELMLRMIHKYSAKLAYVQKVLVRMRAGGVSNVSVKNRLAANRNDRRAWQLNGIRPYPVTILLKPFRKILQFIR